MSVNQRLLDLEIIRRNQDNIGQFPRLQGTELFKDTEIPGGVGRSHGNDFMQRSLAVLQEMVDDLIPFDGKNFVEALFK